MTNGLTHRAEIAVRSYLSINIYGYQFPQLSDPIDAALVEFPVRGK